MAGSKSLDDKAFLKRAAQAGKVAEQRRITAAAEAENGPVRYVKNALPRPVLIAGGILAALGLTTAVVAVGYTVLDLRNDPNVQETASGACNISSELAGVAAVDACITRVDSVVYLSNISKDGNVSDVLQYASDAQDAYITPIQPSGSAALVIEWQTNPTEQYAMTALSQHIPSDVVTAGDITVSLDSFYDTLTDPEDKDAVYEMCMADNAVRIAAIRRDAEKYAGEYEVVDRDQNPILNSTNQAVTMTLTQRDIQDPTMFIDPLDFAPYTYTAADARSIEGAVDGALKPAKPTTAHREIIQFEAGVRLICPVPEAI
jgi:hypothetical protein